MKDYILKLTDGVALDPQLRFTSPVNVEIGQRECVAITGNNGIGKTVLVEMLLGKCPLIEGELDYNFPKRPPQTPHDMIEYVAFQDAYGPADDNLYYQQRWNSTGQEDYPTVRSLLGRNARNPLCKHLVSSFNLKHLLDKEVVLLSGGELRKLHIIRALLKDPELLIIDNPYAGLDAVTRKNLDLFLRQLYVMGTKVVLVLPLASEIPDYATHVILIHLKNVCQKFTREDFLMVMSAYERQEDLKYTPSNYPYEEIPVPTEEIIRLNNVSIRYGKRKIIKDLDWVVREGEKWALSGENGSGKSALLSLIYADNPQAYACDITLFGRKRGTGESIWEIKKNIGYVSPEIHRAYRKNIPAIEIVASGLYDSIGLYKRPQPGDLVTCEAWMKVFGIVDLKDRPYLQLSSGEQRLVLLTRAFVKDPSLLILDEPYHGLDRNNRRRVKEIIENFCKRKGKTLIMVTHNEDEWPSAITHRLELNMQIKKIL
jgi:molybdate transport system ATP-binding protein